MNEQLFLSYNYTIYTDDVDIRITQESIEGITDGGSIVISQDQCESFLLAIKEVRDSIKDYNNE